MRLWIVAVVLGLSAAGCAASSGSADSMAPTAIGTVSQSADPMATAPDVPLTPFEEAAVAFLDVRTAGEEYDAALVAWVNGDTPTGPESTRAIQPLHDALAALDYKLDSLKGQVGVASLKQSIAKYLLALDRAEVLLGQGETAYAREKPSKGSLDCYNEQAALLWRRGAKALYAGRAALVPSPPISDAANCS